MLRIGNLKVFGWEKCMTFFSYRQVTSLQRRKPEPMHSFLMPEKYFAQEVITNINAAFCLSALILQIVRKSLEKDGSSCTAYSSRKMCKSATRECLLQERMIDARPWPLFGTFPLEIRKPNRQEQEQMARWLGLQCDWQDKLHWSVNAPIARRMNRFA